MSDEEFIARFEACTISGDDFHHADHVRAGFLYLRRYPVMEALQRLSSGLLKFAVSKGKPERYNETMTWAFLFLIRERMARAGRMLSWEEFAAENGDLMSWENNILKKYYCEGTLGTDLAKRVFLLPDRVGF